MQKRMFLVLVVAVILLLAVTAVAHSGRTDSNGGHWDRSTGEYHYHHGEPPHDHYDIDGDGDLDCPIRYERANKQASESKTSNWGKLIFWGIVACLIYILVLVFFVRSSNDEFSEGCGCIVAYVIFGIVAGFIEEYPLYALLALTLLLSSFILGKLYKQIDHKRHIDEYERTVNEYISCLEKYESLVSEYLTFYRIPVPDDCEIKYGLPVHKGVSIGYGDKFTVYQSCNGGKVHTVRGCCSVFNEKHIYDFKQYSDFDSMLCKKCSSNYVTPDMSWYENYLQYIKLLRDIFDLYDKRAELKEEVIQQRKACNKFLVKFILIFDKQSRKRLKETNKIAYSLQVLQAYKNNQDTKI